MPRETPASALALAKGAARFNQYRLTLHAEDQMEERKVTRRDLNVAIARASSAIWDPSNQSWKILGGTDSDGAILEPAVIFAGHRMVVKTVMG